jgi:hypothetical protein
MSGGSRSRHDETERCEAQGVNPTENETFSGVLDRRLSRRVVLGGLAVGTVSLLLADRSAPAAIAKSSLRFEPVPRALDQDHHVAKGYRADVLIRWGDEIYPDSPAWDPFAQSAEKQLRQFGYNNDFVAYLPLPPGSNNSEHGLLHIQHEYCEGQMMIPGHSNERRTRETQAIELASLGITVLEVRKERGRWNVMTGSRYTRRITDRTPMHITGPAAGSDRMKTAADPSGKTVLGTLNNCAGGKTPWGTVLVAEENFNYYFGADDLSALPQAESYKRYTIKNKARYPNQLVDPRFNLSVEPNEANRFGWIVEYDPYDPDSVPVKRTALGRFKHEAATVVVNRDGRIIVYSGDDERFEYVFKYVSNGRYDPRNSGGNATLLDDGTLYVAKFDAESVSWLPLVYGQGPLTPANGFNSQADVLIDCRRAGDALGATKMDRPEDIETHPTTGKVYVSLTKNDKRKADQTDQANPRSENKDGHVLELIPPGKDATDRDHAASVFSWDVFILAGDPENALVGAKYHAQTEIWLACPDNLAFDPEGRLWIATDQGASQLRNQLADGLFGVDTEGDGRALVKQFYAIPIGAELCGPEFTPDGKTLFVAVQHPGEDPDEDKAADVATATTRWPDFIEGEPPRPSIVVITKNDGGVIGT